MGVERCMCGLTLSIGSASSPLKGTDTLSLMRRLFRFLLLVALGVAAGAAVRAALRRRGPEPFDDAWPPLTDKGAAPTAATPPSEPWVLPEADGSCPDGYPVKAKMGSKVFHVEGGSLYERTRPERCYSSAAAAEKDGFRQSKR